MSSRGAARTITTLILLSCFSGVVLANDAGTGGDAGSSTSTAAWLPATNATYYGNLTSSNDTNDYYGVNMSNDTGISVGLTSPSNADFDLYLYNSSGNQIDSSLSTAYLLMGPVLVAPLFTSMSTNGPVRVSTLCRSGYSRLRRRRPKTTQTPVAMLATHTLRRRP